MNTFELEAIGVLESCPLPYHGRQHNAFLIRQQRGINILQGTSTGLHLFQQKLSTLQGVRGRAPTFSNRRSVFQHNFLIQTEGWMGVLQCCHFMLLHRPQHTNPSRAVRVFQCFGLAFTLLGAVLRVEPSVRSDPTPNL